MSVTRTVTAVEIQAKRRNRFSVFLDGEFAFGVHRDVLLQADIAKGDKLTEHRVRDILDLENRKQAESQALRLLAYRARSKKEILDRLKQKGYSTAVIEGVLKELERLGLVALKAPYVSAVLIAVLTALAIVGVSRIQVDDSLCRCQYRQSAPPR